MEQAVLRAFVGCIDFIANSPNDVIDPDAAVRALEDVSYALKTLPPDKQAALAEEIRTLADHADQERAAFIRSVPEAMGLTS